MLCGKGIGLGVVVFCSASRVFLAVGVCTLVCSRSYGIFLRCFSFPWCRWLGCWRLGNFGERLSMVNCALDVLGG